MTALRLRLPPSQVKIHLGTLEGKRNRVGVNWESPEVDLDRLGQYALFLFILVWWILLLSPVLPLTPALPLPPFPKQFWKTVKCISQSHTTRNCYLEASSPAEITWLANVTTEFKLFSSRTTPSLQGGTGFTLVWEVEVPDSALVRKVLPSFWPLAQLRTNSKHFSFSDKDRTMDFYFLLCRVHLG